MGGNACASSTWSTMHEEVEPVAVAGGAALVGLGLAALVLAWAWRHRALLLAALFTRLTREDVRAHPLRARLAAEVAKEPGRSTADLARHVAGNEGTVLYHLRVLEKASVVKSLVDGRARRWIEAGAPVPAPPDPEPRRRVLDAVREAPGATLTDVARRVGLAKSTAHHHVAPLVREGRVEGRRVGRTLRLYPGEDDARRGADVGSRDPGRET